MWSCESSIPSTDSSSNRNLYLACGCLGVGFEICDFGFQGWGVGMVALFPPQVVRLRAALRSEFEVRGLGVGVYGVGCGWQVWGAASRRCPPLTRRRTGTCIRRY